MPSNLTSVRVRFSLRGLLFVLALVSVGIALLFSAPSHVAVPGLIIVNVLLPAYLTAGIIYWRGALRAFCIGALFPAGLMFLVTTWHVGYSFLGKFQRPSQLMEYYQSAYFLYRSYSIEAWMLAIASGAMVVALRDRVMTSIDGDEGDSNDDRH